MMGDERHQLVEEVQRLLISLCRIPSPSRDERAIADMLRSRLEALGASVREDGAAIRTGGNAGNLIAELPGGRIERIVLAAHMDTVPLVAGEELAPVVEGTVMRASGRQILGADDKAGVSIVLTLLERLAQVPFERRPTVIAVLTVCEELGLLGAQHLDVRALRADFAYSFDGEVPVGELITAAVYKESLTLRVVGRAAHAALEPERGVHAILVAADVLRALPIGRVAADQVCNIGGISGGGPSNVVPAEVVLTGEARAFGAERLEELIETIETRVVAAAKLCSALVEVKRQRLYDGYAIATDAVPVARLMRVAEHHGITPRTVSSIGGSDTNIFNQKGLATVNIGVGMNEIHSVNEWIDVSGLIRVIAWVEEAILAQ